MLLVLMDFSRHNLKPAQIRLHQHQRGRPHVLFRELDMFPSIGTPKTRPDLINDQPAIYDISNVIEICPQQPLSSSSLFCPVIIDVKSVKMEPASSSVGLDEPCSSRSLVH